MKKFVIKVTTFIFVLLLILFLGALLPTTPRASESLLFAYNQKIDRLNNLEGKRIIFIGGSNLSFGLDSRVIEDSLGLQPVNLGLHALLGLKFIIESSEVYIRDGDIIVIAPEYSHFYKGLNSGSEELLRMGMDVDKRYFNFLNLSQIYNCLEFLPKYVYSKFKLKEYSGWVNSKYYSVSSFNAYGDVVAHWSEKGKYFEPFGEFKGELNENVIEYLQDYNLRMSKRNVKVFISFPVYQRSSYQNSLLQIKNLEERLHLSRLKILGSADRYAFPDSLFFNTPYHLNGMGVTTRSNYLLEDLKLSNNH